jgi:isoquinoline 1-oxidoreductase alpha subunit
MPTYNLKINGKTHSVEADSDTPLLWVLRDQVDLVGTKYGCGIAQCGACTVHINGVATRSCILPVSNSIGKEITTIEGLSENGDHPVQVAWKEIDVPQCGYCQAGQIMTASAFLNNNTNPSKADIRMAMEGNICRCASYNSIEKAIEVAANKLS